jgi:hypothetical protein
MIEAKQIPEPEGPERAPSGAEAQLILLVFAARLKSCPDTKPGLFKTSLVPGGKWQQGDVPGLLDGAGQAALMRGANAGEPTGHYLASLGHEPLQEADVAVRDGVNFFRAKLADLLATEKLSAAARPTGWAAAGSALRASAAGAGSRAGFRCLNGYARVGRPSRIFF